VPESLDAANPSGSSVFPAVPSTPLTSMSASGVAIGPALGEDEVEFLCPNNHLLHGPSSLEGKAGQCPECGSRFRIPVYDEDAADELDDETKPQISVRSILEGDASAVPHEPLEQPSRDHAITTLQIPESGTHYRGSHAHPLIGLFARLWNWKAAGATLEIQFGEQRLTPDQFLRSYSYGSHGVFAVREPDGTHSVTAIAWDSISSVVVRGVRKLPED
jgi:hypothetical protein